MTEPLPTGPGGASLRCPQCDATNDQASRFCRSCGAALRAAPPTRVLSEDAPEASGGSIVMTTGMNPPPGISNQDQSPNHYPLPPAQYHSSMGSAQYSQTPFAAPTPPAAPATAKRRLAVIAAAVVGLVLIGALTYFLVFRQTAADLVVGKWAAADSSIGIIEFTEDGRVLVDNQVGSYEIIDDNTMKVTAPDDDPENVDFTVNESELRLVPTKGDPLRLSRIK